MTRVFEIFACALRTFRLAKLVLLITLDGWGIKAIKKRGTINQCFVVLVQGWGGKRVTFFFF